MLLLMEEESKSREAFEKRLEVYGRFLSQYIMDGLCNEP
jgi:hypothetical protein